jgi:hypothetical protein
MRNQRFIQNKSLVDTSQFLNEPMVHLQKSISNYFSMLLIQEHN